MFVPLHVKSEYSLGLGTAPVEELLRLASERGFAALALTDVENLYGQVRFHLAARSHGVRPITGLELRGPWRLVMLARDLAGYESLCRIVSRRREDSIRESEPLDFLRG